MAFRSAAIVNLSSGGPQGYEEHRTTLLRTSHERIHPYIEQAAMTGRNTYPRPQMVSQTPSGKSGILWFVYIYSIDSCLLLILSVAV